MDMKDKKDLKNEEDEVFPISPELDQAIYEAFLREDKEWHDETTEFIPV